MKNVRISTLLMAAAALVLVVGAANVMADCGRCGDEKKADDAGRCGGGGGCGGEKKADACERGGAERLGLTEEEGAKVRAIMGEAHEAMKAWREENAEAFKDLRERYKAAKEAGDEAKLKELHAEKEELTAGAKALHEQYEQKLSELLTDEQMAKLKKVMMSRRHGARRHHRARANRRDHLKMMGEKLGLTDEQKAQVKAILTDAHEQAKAAETREEKKTIFQAAKDKIHTEVLTAEQQAKAKECAEKHGGGKCGPGPEGSCGDKGDRECGDRAGRGRRRPDMRQMMAEKLGLTDEQQAEMKAITDAAAAQAEAAETREAKGDIRKAAHEQIFNEVFTPEQQAKAKAMREAFAGHRGRGGGRGGSRGCGGKDHDAAKCGCGGKEDGGGKCKDTPKPDDQDALVIEAADE